MEAIHITAAGGAEVLKVGPLELRAPGMGEVKVSVRAAGVNRADILQRKGLYPAPPARAGWSPEGIPGLEFAGEVLSVGPGVTGFSLGDRVMGLSSGGGYARELLAPQGTLMPLPPGMSFREAAAIPEAFITAYDALYLQGGLTMGQRVLVHAAASGVGTAALQLIHQGGGYAIGTSRSPEKLEGLSALGMDEGLVVEGGKFADAILEATGGQGVDVILDLVGGSYVAEGLKCIKSQGRIILVGLLAGRMGTLNLGHILGKRVTLKGTVLRSRSLEEKVALIQTFGDRILPLFEAGSLSAKVDEVFPMSEAGEAHRLLESNKTVGKVVLEW